MMDSFMVEGDVLRSIKVSELVQLCAVDNDLFSRTFFPKTVRQKSPSIHREIWKRLEDPSIRFVNLRCFRGSAKTSLLRMFVAKRISYNVSKTILFAGVNEKSALRSGQWLRRHVERNALWTSTFGLRPGRKWQETEFEVFHGIDEQPIWTICAGITGGVRGINFEDYRPDLIVLDDVVDDENALTEDQRRKISDLVMGAMKHSLAPIVTNPNAKMVMNQTPIHGDDVSMQLSKDPEWHTEVFPCWTKETMDLPDEQKESAWPELFPKEELLKMKRSAVAMNRVSVFSREMECRIVSSEDCAFRKEWIKFYDVKPRNCFTMIAIDPVPPPSQQQLAKRLVKKDFEAIVVVGRYGGKYSVLDYALKRGHEPNWTIATTFQFAIQYRAAAIVVESVQYQRTLQWILKNEMAKLGRYWPVIPFVDGRQKYNRIVSTLSGPFSSGLVHVHSGMTEFVQQFCDYPNIDHEDLLDASAIGLSQIMSPALERADGRVEDALAFDDDVEVVDFPRFCP